MTTPITNVATNIITGFLGVGKTTAILHLLASKPSNERWAVLVNEFGDIGIDGGLLNADDTGIFIKEVPGGCMCCAAGLPMQIALNILLQKSKPDRLLIEPTGLGHPKEVLETLSSKHYESVLNVQNTITLVDARKVADEKYTNHPIFIQQLEVADAIVTNKSDLYGDDDLNDLQQFLKQQGIDSTPLYSTTQGKLDTDWLNGQAQAYQLDPQAPAEPWIPAIELPNLEANRFPECGYIHYSKTHDGFHYKGWKFKPNVIFNADKLQALIQSTDAERIKGIFITDQGIASYNYADAVLTERTLAEAADSRIEIIAPADNSLEAFEAALISLYQV